MTSPHRLVIRNAFGQIPDIRPHCNAKNRYRLEEIGSPGVEIASVVYANTFKHYHNIGLPQLFVRLCKYGSKVDSGPGGIHFICGKH